MRKELLGEKCFLLIRMPWILFEMLYQKKGIPNATLFLEPSYIGRCVLEVTTTIWKEHSMSWILFILLVISIILVIRLGAEIVRVELENLSKGISLTTGQDD
jgi:hypothetical protein